MLALALFAFAPNSEKKGEEIVVVIDVSHGGDDAGVQVSSLSEKELVQQIAKRIEELNSYSNLKIHFTRTSDFNASLTQRVDFISDIQPDLVISLHINESKNTDASGAELYTSTKSARFSQSDAFAKRLQSALLKTSLQQVQLKNADFYILKKSEAPTVLLQLGYLTNSVDRKLLMDPSTQDAIAHSILKFLSEI
jgi:N-acetylmuramoyl-L-alanine amidase